MINQTEWRKFNEGGGDSRFFVHVYMIRISANFQVPDLQHFRLKMAGLQWFLIV